MSRPTFDHSVFDTPHSVTPFEAQTILGVVDPEIDMKYVSPMLAKFQQTANRIVLNGSCRSSRRTRKNLMANPAFKISDLDGNIVAALVVVEMTDNPTLKAAIDNLVVAAKMADAERFVEAKEIYEDNEAVVFVKPAKVTNTFLGFFGSVIEERKSPWHRLMAGFTKR